MKTTQFVITLFVSALTFSLAGCDDHFTTQEAYEICTQLQEENSSSASPESFADCVDCHESCGADCQLQGTVPETYACDEELDDAGGGGAGGGAGAE